MRFQDPLDGLFFSKTATRVLRTLSKHPERKLTSNELAGAAGAPTHRVLEVLGRFELEGLVRSRVVGRAYLWSVNESNPLFQAARDLFGAESRAHNELVRLVRERLVKEGNAERIILFGSAARREEAAASDLDLLVVARGMREKQALEGPLTLLKEDAQDRFGTRVRPLVYTSAEYARKRRSPLLQAIEREGVTLHRGDA